MGAGVTEKENAPPAYAVIRWQDKTVVATFDYFPESAARALMYRSGGVVSFMPLEDDVIVATPTLIMQMLERAGYRVSTILTPDI